MVEEAAADPDPLDAGLRYWRLVTDDALVYGPLFFELSSHAMLGLPHAVELRERLVTTWLDALTAMWRARGVPGSAGAAARRGSTSRSRAGSSTTCC